MSAFLFVISDELIKKLSINELNNLLNYYDKILSEFDWSKYKQCDFESDRASGYKAGKIKIEAELQNRSSGESNPLPKIIVPGFNP